MAELDQQTKALLDAYIERRRLETDIQVRNSFDELKSRLVKAAITAGTILGVVFGFSIKTLVENVATAEVNKQSERTIKLVDKIQDGAADLDQLRRQTTNSLSEAIAAAGNLQSKSKTLLESLAGGEQVLNALGALKDNHDQIVLAITRNTNFLREVKETIAKQNSLLPKGSIVLWHVQDKPPDGWAVCDGTQGTPDLRGRFPYGASSPNEIGQTGGSATHTHTGKVSTPSPKWMSDDANDRPVAHPSHTHKLTIDPASNLPPYLAITFIMKLS